MEKEKCYQAVDQYSGKDIKQKNDVIVDKMLHKNEISLKVAEYLKGGKCPCNYRGCS